MMFKKRLFLFILFSFLHAFSLFATPRRIICLAPSITEIVYALGAGRRVVGVSNFSNYPPAATKKTKIGPFTTPNLEAIIALRPDLVIGLKGANPAWVFKRLKKLNIQVLLLKNGGIDTIWENILCVGKALDKEVRAKDLVKKLQEEINTLTQRIKNLPKPKVFFQLSLRPLFTCGRPSYLHDLIVLAGGINIAGDVNIPYSIVSLEKVVANAPQVIILCLRQEDVKQALKFWKRFPKIPAVKEHRLYAVNPDLFARPSPRIVRALEVLINLLHFDAPDKKDRFGDKLLLPFLQYNIFQCV